MVDLISTSERETLIEAVKLSGESVDGLYPEQIKLMRSTVVDVNSALNVSGNALRSAMEDLQTLKSNVGHGNWRAFLKSGALNISEKSAADLVNAYEKWIGTDEGEQVKDYVLSAMTPRTLSAVANASTEVKNLVQSKVMDGGKITEAEVRKMSAKKRSKPTDKAANQIISNIRNSKDLSSEEQSQAVASFKEQCMLYEKSKKLAEQLERIKTEMEFVVDFKANEHLKEYIKITKNANEIGLDEIIARAKQINGI